jgi:hypothetical protein
MKVYEFVSLPCVGEQLFVCSRSWHGVPCRGMALKDAWTTWNLIISSSWYKEYPYTFWALSVALRSSFDEHCGHKK